MAYSFTEKKRIRKDFGKRPRILDVPFCWRRRSTPTVSSCRRKASRAAGEDIGLHAAFKTVLPIESYSGNAVLEYVSYTSASRFST
jgi:DNA-directed RNA polymerase subunit beta